MQHRITFSLTLTLLTLLFTPNPALADNWEYWLTDVDEAKTFSEDEGQPLFIFYHGQGWCLPCMELAAEVIETDEFTEYVAANFTLLSIAVPRSGALEDPRHREFMAPHGQPPYPMVIVAEHDGTPYAFIPYSVLDRTDPDQTVSRYIDHVTYVQESRDSVRGLLDAAQKQKGEERMASLDEALQLLVDNRVLIARYDAYTEIMAELIKYDKKKKGRLGYQNTYDAMLLEFEVAEAYAAAQTNDDPIKEFKALLKEVDKRLKERHWSTATHAQLLLEQRLPVVEALYSLSAEGSDEQTKYSKQWYDTHDQAIAVLEKQLEDVADMAEDEIQTLHYHLYRAYRGKASNNPEGLQRALEVAKRALEIADEHFASYLHSKIAEIEELLK